ncbi:DUF805 domain-containing protein [Microvirga sp. ACRRW]|uniref:DUF805 domain-containing protein n=1 Tax=Microvirga sp. ACRRW TaxID=2918205 RepID=UPI001EF650E6|nr:DUF805 domain-containing protein [Microvirga sp. ACRRW]
MRDFILSQFSIAGRTSRKDFLRRWLQISYIGLFLMVAGIFLASQGFRFAGYATAGLILIIVIANYAMVIRRYHDRNRSGWWLIASFGINLGGYFAEQLERTHPTVFLLLALALLIANLWFLIELFFRRGTIGPNRFGEDPSGAHPLAHEATASA